MWTTYCLWRKMRYQNVENSLVKETSTVCHSSFGRYPHTVEGHYVWFSGCNEGIGPGKNFPGHYSKQAEIKWSQISPWKTNYGCLLPYPCMPSPKFSVSHKDKTFKNISGGVMYISMGNLSIAGTLVPCGLIGHIGDLLIIFFWCIVGRKRAQNLPIFEPFSFPQCIRKG